MAPRSVNKRVTKEASSSPDIDKVKQRKKKLTDKLGPQWTKGELERFYDAYRKHGRDWKKVAASVRSNRSADMVEALFSMNRAYLSLPEGTASVAGLIAMMTDHYSVIEESESEGEGHGASGVSRKYQKRKRAKVPPSDVREEVISPHSIASTEGCLSFLKTTQVYGRERRATGKRTPRFLVPSADQRDDTQGSTPPNKRAKKQLEADADDDDDDDDILALALANASTRVGGSPYRRPDTTPNVKMSQAKEAQSKHQASSMSRNVVRISRDRRHIKRSPDRDGALLMDIEGVGNAEVPRKEKNVRTVEAEGDTSDDSGEACNAPRDGLEALHALADLSALLTPGGLMESESSAELKEERVANTRETVSSSHTREKAKQAGREDHSVLHVISAADSRKPKSAQELVDGNAVPIGELDTSRRKRKPLHNKESAEDDNLKTSINARRVGQGPAKQQKTAKTSEESCSTSDKKITRPNEAVSATQVSGSGPASLPQKPPNRRKISLKKSLQERTKSSETTHNKSHSYEIDPEHELLKDKVSTCLSHPLVRRRCIFEWFYSAIDYPWFAKMEFVDYLNHVGLGHVPRLTRLEWSVIKRPRRFSERFVHEERDKLEQYRESVRKQYAELRAGAREVLHTDLAQPLSVGNRVIAIHPKTREIRDGKILTIDHNKYNVLFDELGVDVVMDIDCMPLNPLEYTPDGLRRQMDNCLTVCGEAQVRKHPSSDASVLFTPSELENVEFSMSHTKKEDDRDRRVTTDQTYNTANRKERRDEIQQDLMLERTSDAQEMEPEMLGIVSGSRSIAQAMVDAAIKAASSVMDDKDAGKMVIQALDSIGEHHQPLDNSIVSRMKHQDQANGSLDHHHQNRSPSNTGEAMNEGLMGSGKNETQMDSELISSCVATWLMIQKCTEKQYPPGDVAQVMETAVSSLQPRCPQNMPIYREIQTCMGWIKNQIMALAERYKAANQRAVQLLEKCGTTQVEVDASGLLTYPTEKGDAGSGDQPDKKLKPLSVDEERFMRVFYEAKVQEVCSAFEFPHKIQATALQYFKRFYLQWLTCVYAACKIEENHVSAEEIGKGIKQDHHSLEFDLIVYAPYRAIEGFIGNMEEFLQARDDEIQKLEILLKAATGEADKVMLTDAPLLFPPGQLALAALRIANGVLGVVDFDRYLENIVSQPNSEHTTSELTRLLDDIESLVKKYKYPSEKDMKHINRKLKSCLGHSSSHDESKKREKRSKHKSHRSSSDIPKEAPIG
uniref:DIRP domain-containing protein n=2 Tax=Brassica campestris TaxID=3711 RepID=M4D0F2_BRACM